MEERVQQRPPRWSRSEASGVRGEADGAALFGEQQVQGGLAAACDHPPSVLEGKLRSAGSDPEQRNRTSEVG